MGKLKIQIESEVGILEGVILHTPGSEVENMTPNNIEKALYSDILNLPIAQKEYKELNGVLEKVTSVFKVKDLLKDVLSTENGKNILVERITKSCNTEDVKSTLLEQSPENLAKFLIEGVPVQQKSLTNYLNKKHFELEPLHNFFFTRDASSVVNDTVFINKMANSVRRRESVIMEAIFKYHPNFIAKTSNPEQSNFFNEKISTEGGDILVARNDVLLIGTGIRTSPEGIDYIAKQIDSKQQRRHIIVQELPKSPESFIHLDMVFTLLDHDKCMVYEPLIMKSNQFKTLHLIVENGEIKSINEFANILTALKNIGMSLEPIFCGGKNQQNQEREQWHSGANFFAFAPGKIIGYERNSNTINTLSQDGFSVLKAKDVISGKENVDDYKKVVVTIQGSELARGGGGARCMTMPIRRQKL